jgi:hypothetical protein
MLGIAVLKHVECARGKSSNSKSAAALPLGPLQRGLDGGRARAQQAPRRCPRRMHAQMRGAMTAQPAHVWSAHPDSPDPRSRGVRANAPDCPGARSGQCAQSSIALGLHAWFAA